MQTPVAEVSRCQVTGPESEHEHPPLTGFLALGIRAGAHAGLGGPS